MEKPIRDIISILLKAVLYSILVVTLFLPFILFIDLQDRPNLLLLVLFGVVFVIIFFGTILERRTTAPPTEPTERVKNQLPIEPYNKNIEGNQSSTEIGLVKWFDKSLGYGFIEKDDGDVFVHSREIKNTKADKNFLLKGQKISYQTLRDNRGIRAINVVSLHESVQLDDATGNIQSTESVYPDAERSFANANNNDCTPTDQTESNTDPSQDLDTERQEGLVRWFNAQKRYGFISNVSGDDVFIHLRHIIKDENGSRNLKIGQRVSYKIRKSEHGDQAEEVMVIADESSYSHE